MITNLNSICSKGCLYTIKQIMNADTASINIKDEWGNTPLHIACKYGYLDIVKYLLKKGICVNTINMFGDTPLHYACKIKNLEIVKLLIKRGVNVNISNKFPKETPLHIACRNGDLNIIRELIKNGADVNVKNNEGNTPLCIIRKEKYIKTNNW